MRLSGFHKAYQQALYFKWRTNGAAGERASKRATKPPLTLASPFGCHSRMTSHDIAYCLTLIALFIILAPSRRVNSIKIYLSRDLRTRTLACFYARIFKFSAITSSHIFTDEGSIAETSEFYLQLSAFNLPPSQFFLTISTQWRTSY